MDLIYNFYFFFLYFVEDRSYISFCELLWDFSQVWKPFRRIEWNTRNFFKLPFAHFYRISRSERPSEQVNFVFAFIDNLVISFFICSLIFAVSATRGLWRRAYLAEESRLFGSGKRHKLGAEEQYIFLNFCSVYFLIFAVYIS